MRRLLVVFTRLPDPGAAKTRLIPALGAAGAADLQRRMTRRTLARVGGAPPGEAAWELLVRFDGGDAAGMAALAGPQVRCAPQGPGDLGERLWRAFAEGFAGGADAIAIVGADCPDLGAADVADAFRELGSADAVFGPARDGGYWLVGLRRAAVGAGTRVLFEAIPWGGPEVLASSLAAARRGGLRVAPLRTLADVDRPEDLAVWERALRGDAAGEEITVIVPTLHEAGRVGALVAELCAEDAVQVIVADGGSADGSAAEAAAAGARVIVAPAGRGRQMNAGAAAACGEILLFLHADTRLPPGWAGRVRAALRDPRVAGGAFGFATDSPRRGLRLVEAGAALRVRLFGVVYGDQAIFARRRAFAAVGGFPEQPLMEDWELVRALRRRGAFRLLPERAVTSARRWERNGLLRTAAEHALVLAAYAAGVSPGRLARWYRTAR